MKPLIKNLKMLNNGFKANKLSLNVSKNKFMIFRASKMQNVNQDFLIQIGEQSIERIGNDYNTKSL